MAPCVVVSTLLLLLAVQPVARQTLDCDWEDVTRIAAVAVAEQDGEKLRIAILDSGAQLGDPAMAPSLFRNRVDPPGSAVNGGGSPDGCPGRCGVDDDGDGFADRADPEVAELIARFERACAAAGSAAAVCNTRPDGSNPRLNRLLDLDDDENGLPDDYHGYDFYAESECLINARRDLEPCRPEGPPNAHGAWVAGAFQELGLAGRVELVIVRITEGSHGRIAVGDAAWQRAFAYAVERGARIIVFAGGALNRGLCPRLDPLFEADDPLLLVTAAGNLGLNLDEVDDRKQHWPGQCGYPATLLAGAAVWDWPTDRDPCPVRAYPASMVGRAIDLMAPGSLRGGRFRQTSAAASYLAAAAARLWLSEGFADCDALGIRRALREGSQEIGDIRAGTVLADGRFLDLAGARDFGCVPMPEWENPARGATYTQ